MTIRPISAMLTLIVLSYLLSGCENQSKTPAPAVAAPKTEAHSQHAKHMMDDMDAMMQRTKALKMTGDFDVDFANMMIEHHQGAIDMSKVELEAGTDAEMKTMAQQIITAQQAEIATLRTFVQNHPAKAANQQSMHGNSMETMHNQMKSMAMSGKVDHDFASMMKVHHQGAVAMAQEALIKGKHAEIKQMAQQMIADQQREIAVFQTWLGKNGH